MQPSATDAAGAQLIARVRVISSTTASSISYVVKYIGKC
jgi:hypothetical protein